MPIRFACPHCDTGLVAPDQAMGKKARCKQCARSVLVPDRDSDEEELLLLETELDSVHVKDPPTLAANAIHRQLALLIGLSLGVFLLLSVACYFVATNFGPWMVAGMGFPMQSNKAIETISPAIATPAIAENPNVESPHPMPKPIPNEIPGTGSPPVIAAAPTPAGKSADSASIAGSARPASSVKSNTTNSTTSRRREGSTDRTYAIERALMYRWEKQEDSEFEFKIVDEGNSTKIVDGTCKLVPQPSTPNKDEGKGAGTGFAISSDGLIATCAHVVYTSSAIQVMVGDVPFPAKIVSIDIENDLAILKIENDDLVPLSLAESEQVPLAQPVIAFGFPLTEMLGTGVKVTSGYVSGVVDKPPRGPLIGLDVSLNPGNSGGPVVDEFGRVIGVASMKLSSGGALDSVGLACPAERLRQLIDRSSLALHGVPLPSESPRTRPELAAEVAKSVVLIQVQGRLSEKVQPIQCQTYYQHRSNLILSGTNQNKAMFKMTALGAILSFDDSDHLPFALGPIAALFIEPLDPVYHNEWTVNRSVLLQKQTKQSLVPFGPRFAFPFRTFGSPFTEGTKPVDSEPAQFKIGYRAIEESDDKIVFERKYRFQTLDDETSPRMLIEGDGRWQFDLKRGSSDSLDQKLRVQVKGSEPSNIRITYARLGQGEIAKRQAKQREENLLAQEKDRIEREVPNPKLAAQILKELRDAGFTSKSWFPLHRLSVIAVVEELQTEAIELIRLHLNPANSSHLRAGRLTPNSVEAFCRWSNDSCEKELLGLIKNIDSDPDIRLILTALGRIKNPELLPVIAKYLSDTWGAETAEKVLIAKGTASEDALLKRFGEITDQRERKRIVKLLGSHCGTEKARIALESELAKDARLRSEIQVAINQIQSRK